MMSNLVLRRLVVLEHIYLHISGLVTRVPSRVVQIELEAVQPIPVAKLVLGLVWWVEAFVLVEVRLTRVLHTIQPTHAEL